MSYGVKLSLLFLVYDVTIIATGRCLGMGDAVIFTAVHYLNKNNNDNKNVLIFIFLFSGSSAPLLPAAMVTITQSVTGFNALSEKF